ncbi:type I-C CRISPR-associated protein Cas8c/Csd1 [Bombiscardovia apis]|uniref:Type I-C CRISPR-associated protein Cas8c/Csd1 n=1 Tax=Bombiscardovia apis TaxID=2932182 RepID=A0ABN6SGV8_9BIFI|nr:type I-C CRISPR-associated protein Cas8c/Csd1 [Bombiscardovia apis]BDR55229.1 type I-C CRISPR-associated protein Cas8c/Csd1 [Bombiscardovia apis]
MIEALIRLYEQLVKQGKAPKYGYGQENVPFGLDIDAQGRVSDVHQFGETTKNGKYRYMLEVPAHAIRTAGVKANFLCDNSAYMFAVDTDGASAKARKRFDAAAQLHEEILKTSDDLDARAVANFFAAEPQGSQIEQLITEKFGDTAWKNALSANFVLCIDGKPLSTSSVLQELWDTYFSGNDSIDASGGKKAPDTMQSIVSGRQVLPAATHPNIRGVQGAQSSGAALISFNAPAYLSYGKEQDLNAPMSKYEAFAYTTALNTLLKDEQYRRVINKGSLTILCWSESAEPEYPRVMFTASTMSSDADVSQEKVISIVKALSQGHPVDYEDAKLKPTEPFYVLGLAPNAARLSVSFFYKDTFGHLLSNVNQHYEDTAIERPGFDKHEVVSVRSLLQQTVVQRPGKYVEALDKVAADLMQSILAGKRYSASLLDKVEIRIRAEHEINRAKAAIIKAFYLRSPNSGCPKEVLQMTINKDSTNIPYSMGRLFAVYEGLQSAANPGINTTIRDRYFTNACRMPAVVFPLLVDLGTKHLGKLKTKPGLATYYNQQIADLMSRIGEQFPSRLTLAEQGSFQLGYYFQTQERYKKTNKDNAATDQMVAAEEGANNE